jgi:signal transduction histidine kinase
MKKLLALILCTIMCRTFCMAQQESIASIQQQLPHIKDSLKYADALNRISMLIYERNIDSTFYYADLARDISYRHNYTKGKADAANNLGVGYDIKGNSQLGLRYYNEARMLYVKAHDTADIVQAYMNIAMLYNEMGKHQKVIDNFDHAFTTGKELRRDSIMALVYVNYLIIFPDGPKQLIRSDIDEARAIAMKYKDQRTLFAIDEIEADYFIRNHQRNKGIAMLQVAVKKSLANEYNYMSLDMITDLGDQFAATDTAKAIGYYKMGAKIASEKSYGYYQQVFTRKLYDFYISHNNDQKAFYYSKQLIAINDTAQRISSNSGIDYVEYAVKDEQLASAQLQASARLWFLSLAVVAFLMAITIIVILWHNSKKVQKTARLLRLQYKQAESTTEELHAVNKNYLKLIKIVAHDLRSPIGAISNIADMMMEESNTHDELVDLISASSKNCLELINGLLETDFDQNHNLKKTDINLDEFLQQCIGLLNFRAQDKNQQLILKSYFNGSIKADSEKMQRVVNNLVVNAMKFSPENSNILIEAIPEPEGVMIMIKDYGIGIPDELKDNIFDPFTLSKRSGTQGEKPFGLGLYITKQIVEAHEGKIWFKNADGGGTEFYVELPLN